MLLPFPKVLFPRGHRDVSVYQNCLEHYPHVRGLVNKYFADVRKRYPEFDRRWYEAAVDSVSKFLLELDQKDASAERFAEYWDWLSEPFDGLRRRLEERFHTVLEPSGQLAAAAADGEFANMIWSHGYRGDKAQHKVMADLMNVVWLVCLEPEAPHIQAPEAEASASAATVRPHPHKKPELRLVS